MNTDSIDGGFTTTRVATSQRAGEREVRAERDAAAVRYLVRTDNQDLLDALGLTEVAQETGARRCGYCERPFLASATGGTQRYCNRTCASRAAAARRSAKAAQARAALEAHNAAS